MDCEKFDPDASIMTRLSVEKKTSFEGEITVEVIAAKTGERECALRSIYDESDCTNQKKHQ